MIQISGKKISNKIRKNTYFLEIKKKDEDFMNKFELIILLFYLKI